MDATTSTREQKPTEHAQRADIEASLYRYIRAGRDLRERYADGSGPPLSQTLQEALYDDRGLPK